MSKGLEALKDLSKMVFIYGGVEQYKTIEKDLNILKRLKVLIKGVDYIGINPYLVLCDGHYIMISYTLYKYIKEWLDNDN